MTTGKHLRAERLPAMCGRRRRPRRSALCSPAFNALAPAVLPRRAPSGVQGDIEVKGVAFSYPARQDVSVFTSLNLSVAAGQTVALVGASGSGKSTIIQLLERFYDPAAGSITVDGHDIKQLSLGWYRSQVRSHCPIILLHR